MISGFSTWSERKLFSLSLSSILFVLSLGTLTRKLSFMLAKHSCCTLERTKRIERESGEKRQQAINKLIRIWLKFMYYIIIKFEIANIYEAGNICTVRFLLILYMLFFVCWLIERHSVGGHFYSLIHCNHLQFDRKRPLALLRCIFNFLVSVQFVWPSMLNTNQWEVKWLNC